MQDYGNKVLTITGDNSSEFAYHEQISSELDADFFFAHPNASWKRGPNENTNGLVRQYLKKGSCFSKLTDKQLLGISESLNVRSRKTLGFMTPKKVFQR